jgi:Arabinose-binding domain of AraC transcription regulator, N-term
LHQRPELRFGINRVTDETFFFSLEGPLDDAPGIGQVRAANLRGFVDFVRVRNGGPARILARFGLEPRALADPDAHMSCQQFVDILEYCSTLFDDPLFGLRFALAQDADVYGPVTALCRAAPDLRTALRCFVDFIVVAHSPDANTELFIDDNEAELRWSVRSDLGSNDQANFQALVLNLKLLKMLHPGFHPTRIALSNDQRPRDPAEIEQLVGYPVRMNSPGNAIAFPAKLLDQPLSSSDRLIYRLLGGYLGRLKIVNRPNTVQRVQSYVRGALPTGTCAIERCAEQMGISVRTLQIRLDNHGARYTELVEGQRERLARIYLTQTPSNAGPG